MAEEKKVCPIVFHKKSFRGRNVRHRGQKDSDDSSSEDETVAVHKTKKLHGNNPNIQMTGNLKRKQEEEASDNSSDESSAVIVNYKSLRTVQSEGPRDMGATSTLETETETDKDAQAIFERSQAISKKLKEEGDDNLYRGINNYVQLFEKKDSALGNASSGLVRKGPVRAPTNLRATVRWDYQADICKDYKETGYCGFGDSCKFLHDRSDYKLGWQLEREEQEKVKDDSAHYEIHSEDDDDNLPFKCYICRETFKDPVATKCNHYFCEKCALDQYKKSKRCFVCGEQTYGTYKVAKNIIAKLSGAAAKRKQDDDDDAADLPPDGNEDSSSD